VIGLTFLPRGSVLTVITVQLLRCSLLKAARPEGFPDKVPAGPDVPPSSFFSEGCGHKFREWSVLILLWLISCVQSLLYTNFPQPDGKLDCSLRDLQSGDLFEDLIKYLLAPQTQLLP
jgi:hypothetical protein